MSEAGADSGNGDGDNGVAYCAHRAGHGDFADGNHMYTWSFAYNIDAIREWLFAQKKA